jgi:hypothetical protein
MLFHVTWEFINRSEENQRRGLSLFSSWQPPQEVEFKGLCDSPTAMAASRSWKRLPSPILPGRQLRGRRTCASL